LASVVVTVTKPPARGEIAALAGLADGLEVRADLVGDLDPVWLRSQFPGTLTYALPSARGAASTEERHRRLLAAAREYDLVELELECDLVGGLLERIPAERRLVCWRGRADDPAGLSARFERMATVPAGLYLVAVEASTVADGLLPLALLKALGRADVTAFATGLAGGWTRLLAPRLGAPIVFASTPDDRQPGALTVRELRDDYGYPAIWPLREIHGIVGGSERHSLAPRILNTGFRALGMEALYLPFFPADFRAFWDDLVATGLPALGLPLHGLTVVRPHKEAALTVAETTGGRAEQAGAANCLVRDAGAWHAANTTGLIDLLAAAGVDPRGLSVAVVGCGGAGRSVAAELSAHGARVTLVNRGEPRGRFASHQLGLPWISLTDFRPRGLDLVVNATPMAREAPFEVRELTPGSVVADLAYLAGTETALMAAARSHGLAAVDGRQVLAAETGSQFRLMTGQPLPPDAVNVALG
jgi:3-dehydroquinate dehydratase/shikimate dehydrogenase